jgi:hypothetical protein
MAISEPKNFSLFDDPVLNFDPFSLNGPDQFAMSAEDLSRFPSDAASEGASRPPRRVAMRPRIT